MIWSKWRDVAGALLTCAVLAFCQDAVARGDGPEQFMSVYENGQDVRYRIVSSHRLANGSVEYQLQVPITGNIVTYVVQDKTGSRLLRPFSPAPATNPPPTGPVFLNSAKETVIWWEEGRGSPSAPQGTIPAGGTIPTPGIVLTTGPLPANEVPSRPISLPESNIVVPAQNHAPTPYPGVTVPGPGPIYLPSTPSTAPTMQGPASRSDSGPVFRPGAVQNIPGRTTSAEVGGPAPAPYSQSVPVPSQKVIVSHPDPRTPAAQVMSRTSSGGTDIPAISPSSMPPVRPATAATKPPPNPYVPPVAGAPQPPKTNPYAPTVVSTPQPPTANPGPFQRMIDNMKRPFASATPERKDPSFPSQAPEVAKKPANLSDSMRTSHGTPAPTPRTIQPAAATSQEKTSPGLGSLSIPQTAKNPAPAATGPSTQAKPNANVDKNQQTIAQSTPATTTDKSKQAFAQNTPTKNNTPSTGTNNTQAKTTPPVPQDPFSKTQATAKITTGTAQDPTKTTPGTTGAQTKTIEQDNRGLFARVFNRPNPAPAADVKMAQASPAKSTTGQEKPKTAPPAQNPYYQAPAARATTTAQATPTPKDYALGSTSLSPFQKSQDTSGLLPGFLPPRGSMPPPSTAGTQPKAIAQAPAILQIGGVQSNPPNNPDYAPPPSFPLPPATPPAQTQPKVAQPQATPSLLPGPVVAQTGGAQINPADNNPKSYSPPPIFTPPPSTAPLPGQQPRPLLDPFASAPLPTPPTAQAQKPVVEDPFALSSKANPTAKQPIQQVQNSVPFSTAMQLKNGQYTPTPVDSVPIDATSKATPPSAAKPDFKNTGADNIKPASRPFPIAANDTPANFIPPSSNPKPFPIASGDLPPSSSRPYPIASGAVPSGSSKPYPIASGDLPPNSSRPYPIASGGVPSGSAKPYPIASGDMPSKSAGAFPLASGNIASSADSSSAKPFPIAPPDATTKTYLPPVLSDSPIVKSAAIASPSVAASTSPRVPFSTAQPISDPTKLTPSIVNKTPDPVPVVVDARPSASSPPPASSLVPPGLPPVSPVAQASTNNWRSEWDDKNSPGKLPTSAMEGNKNDPLLRPSDFDPPPPPYVKAAMGPTAPKTPDGKIQQASATQTASNSPAPPSPPSATPQGMPAGTSSVWAAGNGVPTQIRYVPVPVATTPELTRAPTPPPPHIPQAPQPAAFVNAFTPPQSESRPPQYTDSSLYARLPLANPAVLADLYARNPYLANANLMQRDIQQFAQMPPQQQAMLQQALFIQQQSVQQQAQAVYMQQLAMAQSPRPQSPYNYPTTYQGPQPPNPFGQQQPVAQVQYQPAPAPYGYPPYQQPYYPNAYPQYPQHGYPQPAPTPGYVQPVDHRVCSADPNSAQEPQQMLKLLSESPYPGQREAAARSLGACDSRGNPQLVPVLLQAARQDPAATVRVACVSSLARMNLADNQVMNTLKSLLSDPDPRVRYEVQQAYIRMGAPQGN